MSNSAVAAPVLPSTAPARLFADFQAGLCVRFCEVSLWVARVRDLRAARQPAAVGGRRALVLSAQAAARLRLRLLGTRVLAARRRGRSLAQQRLDRLLTSSFCPCRSRSRRATRWRGSSCRRAVLILLVFLLPQAFPNLPVYINVARIFYDLGLNGTISASCWSMRSHGLVYAVWIASAAFAAVDQHSKRRRATSAPGRCAPSSTVTLPLAAPGIMASAIFVFLESLDEFTGTFFVGVPDVTTLPLLLYTASMGGNYQIASITALILLVPSIGFMLVVERFLKADVLAKVGTVRHRSSLGLACQYPCPAVRYVHLYRAGDRKPDAPDTATRRHCSYGGYRRGKT